MKTIVEFVKTRIERRKANRIPKNNHSPHPPDRWLVGALILISLFGLIMVYDASVSIALRDFNDQYHFIKDQIRWLGIGYLALFIFSRIDYRFWKQFVIPILLITFILLIAVFIPGIGVRALGAHRWINLGFFVLQPAEIAKISMILYLSLWFSHVEKGRLISFLLLLGMVVGLVLLEPDLGTSFIIVSIAVSLYFLSGAPISHFF